jgi:hypothetical protein
MAMKRLEFSPKSKGRKHLSIAEGQGDILEDPAYSSPLWRLKLSEGTRGHLTLILPGVSSLFIGIAFNAALL